jgi:hypothetical protein
VVSLGDARTVIAAVDACPVRPQASQSCTASSMVSVPVAGDAVCVVDGGSRGACSWRYRSPCG